MVDIQLIKFEIHLIVIDMSHKDLFLCSYVFSSDDDGNPVADIYVGYDASLNLIIIFELTDYDFSEYNSSCRAVIDKHEAYWLSKRLEVSMSDLPRFISNSVDESYYEIINPSVRDTRECFRDLLDCFIVEGCHMRIFRRSA